MPEGRNCWISLRRNLLSDKFPGLLEIILKDQNLASDDNSN